MKRIILNAPCFIDGAYREAGETVAVADDYAIPLRRELIYSKTGGVPQYRDVPVAEEAKKEQ
jgi:hypothetical protein